MNVGYIIAMLCYITDYAIVSAPPPNDIQKRVLPSNNLTERWRLQKQRREQAQLRWDQAERQKHSSSLETLTQEQVKLINGRARAGTKRRKQVLRYMQYEPEPPKGNIDVTMAFWQRWDTNDVTAGLDENHMIGPPEKTSTSTTVDPKETKSPPPATLVQPMTFTHNCDFIAYYCLKTWDTGHLCARSINHQYMNFTNYCEVEYVNCMERYELWFPVHIGYCYYISYVWDTKQYPYMDDFFLDQNYRDPYDEAFTTAPVHYHDKTYVQWHP